MIHCYKTLFLYDYYLKEESSCLSSRDIEQMKCTAEEPKTKKEFAAHTSLESSFTKDESRSN